MKSVTLHQVKCLVEDDISKLRKKVAKACNLREDDIATMQILRRSLDTRKKPVLYYVYSVSITLQQEVLYDRIKTSDSILIEQNDDSLMKEIEPKTALPGSNPSSNVKGKVVVVGFGPAGMFAAYTLQRNGFDVVVLERGETVEERKNTVDLFWDKGILNPESNVQFGEGGAGTFSDGKLNTLVKDRFGYMKEVLSTFISFGAKDEIAYDAKPHIGTDALQSIVQNMRQAFENYGGKIFFQKLVTGFLEQKDQIRAVVTQDGELFDANYVILATGHSARDTYEMLQNYAIPMEAKPFAVGFRVEHGQDYMNQMQYGMTDLEKHVKILGASTYKLTYQTSCKKSVYSFCMCPGGYVVNASSEVGHVAINGMSYSKRDGINANSAIVIGISPEEYCQYASQKEPLKAGLSFQRDLEKKVFKLAGGKIPVQNYFDFVDNQISTEPSLSVSPSTKGSYVYANLRNLLPEPLEKAFIEAMSAFDRMIPGFAASNPILSAVESRTSSPIRIIRNEQLCSGYTNFYPCGEGAGYAGGITSAAMDGLKVANVIIQRS